MDLKSGLKKMERNGQHHSYIAFIKEGQKEEVLSFGKENLSESDLFEIGSLSKGLFGIMVLDSVEKGLLNVDDSIQKYINLPKTYKPITLRHILTHTSGIKANAGNFFSGAGLYKDFSKDDLMKELQESEINLQGEFLYSNLAVGLLQLILEKATKKSFQQLVDDFKTQYGIESLTLKGETIPGFRTSFKKAPDTSLGEIQAAGGLHCNLKDLIKLSKEVMERKSLFHPLKDFKTFSIGYFWGLSDNNNSLSHSGLTNKHSSFFVVNPKNQKVLIVLSNTRSPLDHLIYLFEDGELKESEVPWWTKGLRLFH